MTKTIRRIFRLLNKFFMVPMFRLGFGPFIGNPITGYMMVLKVVGCKSGLTRYTPVNYAILNGSVYCLSGFGTVAHWYHNLKANPRIELILPGGAISGLAEEVTDPVERLHVFRQTLKNSGFAGFMLGFNPHTASDEFLREKGSAYPMIRIRPSGIGIGPWDAGGWMWVWICPFFIAILVWLFK